MEPYEGVRERLLMNRDSPFRKAVSVFFFFARLLQLTHAIMSQSSREPSEGSRVPPRRTAFPMDPH